MTQTSSTSEPRLTIGAVANDSVFASLAVVQLAQEAGFTLAETRALVSGFDRASSASTRWQTMARSKLVEVSESIAKAQRLKALLERLLQCRCETLDQCVRTRTEALRAAAPNSPSGTSDSRRWQRAVVGAVRREHAPRRKRH